MSKDLGKGIDSLVVGVSAVVRDKGMWHDKWTIEKYADQKAYEEGKPYEVVEIEEKNLLLNSGINAMWSLICATGTAFNNANARLGVGDSDTAAGASQTDLQAVTNKTYIAMEATYPTVGTAQKAVFRSIFASADANYNWREFVVKNNSTAVCLNRLVSNQGTKVSGQVWTLMLEITLS